jgi:hypothetical protein
MTISTIKQPRNIFFMYIRTLHMFVLKKMISLITFLSKIEVDYNCTGGEETTPQTLEDEDTTEVTVEVTEVNIRPTEANTRASEANAKEPEASSETGRRKIFVARPRKLDISGISHSQQFKY